VRALVSVWEKDGLDVFARGLAALGFELVASGGTAAFLEELGLDVTRVEDVTQAPEMLGGRVKTLHPRIHAGILARRDRDDDLAALKEQEIEPFDLVCVNLYPFTSVSGTRAPEAEVVEMIDVGGPSMLRAAAKNFLHVAPVSKPEQYGAVLAELEANGALSEETRRALAAEAFALTAAYEAAIANWFGATETFPETLTLTFEKVQDLAYGENPHQRAAYYRESSARRHLLSQVEQLHGRALSFINLYDLSSALALVREFALPACVIVKHANACGAAVAATIEEAYDRALAADPLSAFGMVCVLNRPVGAELGRKLSEQFVDVLFAPDFDLDALAVLTKKPATRILVDRERRSGSLAGELDYKRVQGGLLVQDRDTDLEERETMQVVAGTLTEEQWGDLLFAWRVCKHVWSNAIVIAKNLQTVGIGAGQQSRVDAVRIAMEKSQSFGHDLDGAVLASDAFFPFADGPELALARGVSAIIQPGGSKRDDEVIAAVQAAGASMVFTGRRHFRH
jgi:phosphoribosylaminoimidazolecarboxamide formyltransferase/IMP cyclohydrolase